MSVNETISPEMLNELRAIIKQAYLISADVGKKVERLLEVELQQPMPREDAYRLLTRVVQIVREGAQADGDLATAEMLEGDVEEYVERILEARERVRPAKTQFGGRNHKRVTLGNFNGEAPGRVFPPPMFHAHKVAMMGGGISTTDINLWNGNERLEIHLQEFKQEYGRDPDPQDVLGIMQSKIPLRGLRDLPNVAEVKKKDFFEIEDLANSIARNGVRQPPIIDLDGTLLDGNRRVAACYYILNDRSGKFDSDAKKRASYIFVWQLTEAADNDDRNAVRVALNFEPDYKEPWPEYVRARKIYEAWQEMLSLEGRIPGAPRVREIKAELAQRFALKDASRVSRYIEMVKWADAFEEHHINQKGRDKFEVKHRADRYIQYFDEMAKGKENGVADKLSSDEGFRRLVFDLLYEGKFTNWKQVRDLKKVLDNQEARDLLQRARDEKDPDVAEETLERAIALGRNDDSLERGVGANTRIETFCKWLEKFPVGDFGDSSKVKPETLRRLLRALELVGGVARKALETEVEQYELPNN